MLKRIFLSLLFASLCINAQTNKKHRLILPILKGCENLEKNKKVDCVFKTITDFYNNNIRKDYLNDNNVLGKQKMSISFSYTKEKGLEVKKINIKNDLVKDEIIKVSNLLQQLISSDLGNENIKCFFTLPLTISLKSKKRSLAKRPVKKIIKEDKYCRSFRDSLTKEKRKFSLKEALNYYKISEWKKDMKFKVCNPFRRRSLVVSPIDTLTNKVIKFKRHVLKKDDNQVISIFEYQGEEFQGNTFYGNKYEFEENNSNISKLVYYDEVEKTKELLLNKTFYLLKPIEEEDKIYDAYLIRDVRYYCTDFPVIITCVNKKNDKEYNFALYLSGTNQRTSLLSNEYSEYYKICNFDKYFLSEEDFQERRK